MKLAVMQPYFFPYLGYFDLINYSDKFIVLDNVQYIKGGWVNRNRVLHNHDFWKYITLPLQKYRHDAPISEILIENESRCKKKIQDKLFFYKQHAPYFHSVWELLTVCFGFKETNLSKFNMHCLIEVCKFLQIPFDFEYFSEMNLSLHDVRHAGDWSLKISEALGASEYVNLPGGKGLFVAQDFADRGIDLTFRHLDVLEYPVKSFEFVPNLSIIDVLMWNSPEAVKLYLDSNKLNSQ